MNKEDGRITKAAARKLCNRGISVRVAMVYDRIPSFWFGEGCTFDPLREDCDFDRFVTVFEVMNRCKERGNYAKFFANQ